MKISRTPLRISFFGGGTDYPQWYNQNGGAVLGTSIDKYCYVMFHNGGIWSTFDLPTKSGLGSSSAYTVGLLRVCTDFDKETIAKVSTIWEQDKMGGNVGSQDQYLCAIGGLRHLVFSEHGVRDITLPSLSLDIQNYLMLFDTHQYRRASDIVAHQLESMAEHSHLLIQLGDMVDKGIQQLKENNYTNFGKLMDEAWQKKRELSSYISTPAIDDIYNSAIKAGAMGGKLLGAGGGGFILFVVEPQKQNHIKDALSNLTHVPFKFETEGTKVIYNDTDR